MMKDNDFKERRRHPRVPVINNIVEPIDLVYTDEKQVLSTKSLRFWRIYLPPV